MKMKKRLLSILLSILMVLGLVPGTSLMAYADGVTNYELWVGGTQMTSANMGNVLGDGTVSFAPANGDTPATLTLNGASITTGDHSNSLIYCDLHSDDNMVFYPLNIVLLGTNNVSNSNTLRGINCSGPVTISRSGSLTTHVKNNGIYSYEGIEIKSGTIEAVGYWAIYVGYGKTVTISGGEVTAIGSDHGIEGTVKNSMAGTGWTNTAGTEGETAIEASTTGQNLSSYKKVHFLASSHTHCFTYSASGAALTAKCSADGCTLPEVEGKHIATLTIAAPLHTTYGDGKDATAVITDDNSIQGEAKVQYQKKSGGSYVTGQRELQS